ncbi:MAG TPA: glucosaminidase domain-containing protein [Candidatus Xenobia bacterium]|nr:glucosaminidase domain-containing protein [Candidatus Xenobia bacterium]
MEDVVEPMSDNQVKRESNRTQARAAALLNDDKGRFLAELAPAVQRLAARTGLPASAVLAQAILESNWGRSALARQAHNLFGIKARRGARASATFNTTEYEGGEARREAARFAAYASYEDCLGDYARVLAHPRYLRARRVAANPLAFVVELQRAGYATDPHYAHKLALLIRRYRLTQYDVPRKEPTP